MVADGVASPGGSRAFDYPHAGARGSRVWWVVGLAVAAFCASFGLLHYGPFTHGVLLDTPLYERYGDAIVHRGQIPYRDFSLEYPPAAVPIFAAPSLLASAGDFSSYARWFEVEMLLCGVAAAAFVGLILGRQGAGVVRVAAATLLVGLAPLALGPVVLSRYDLWPVALTTAAVAALLFERPRLAFALLGMAVAAKGYPLVLFPLFAIETARHHGRRESGLATGVMLLVIAAVTGPFLALAPHGVWASLLGQSNRPLQIESLGASVLLVAHQLAGLPLTEVSSHGSDNLAGALPHALASLESVLAVATLTSLWAAFARGRPDHDRLLRYLAAAVCAFVALDRVLSPQYLIWLIALVPLVRGRRGVLASALFVSSMLLTQLWFPRHYIQLVYGLDPRASWLVAARDLCLLALLLVLVLSHRRRRRASTYTIGILVIAAAAATGIALVTTSPARAATHTGLLIETGNPTTCRAPTRIPASTSGTVPYTSTTFPNPGTGSCVRVRITAPNQQIFSAAYRRAFDTIDPRTNYLGDGGRCTHIHDVTRNTLTYAFTAPATTPIIVEVEPCNTSNAVPPYTLDIAAGTGQHVQIKAAQARHIAHATLITWHATGASTITVYRETSHTLTPLGNAHNAFRDHTNNSAAEYWLRASTHNSGWLWHGPLIAKP
jgi:hypothetical protein